mmetsp:Transcript_13444/g.20198  ORF Transcript_13444/g.20198 Transcript_13444/m.20198 type:complete len:80 (-) Transcript_13444:1478-1717(-)
MQNNYVILLPLDFSLSTEKLTFRLKAPFDRSLVSLQFLAFSKASLLAVPNPKTTNTSPTHDPLTQESRNKEICRFRPNA